jgi:hypothetical protein
LATSESTRARRFALPDLADQRTEDAIEAFLEGPEIRRGRPAARASFDRALAPARPSVDLRTTPGRLEWTAALDRESARAARYGRPASVAIVELKAQAAGQTVEPYLPSLAGPIARAIRMDSRATDLVARVAAARFHLLLPETNEPGAAVMADRIAEKCRAQILGTGAPIAVRVSVAGTGLAHTLHDALAHALNAIEAA